MFTPESLTQETAPEAPIWETFRAVFESAAALLADPGERASLQACGWVLTANDLVPEELRAADAALSISLDTVDEARVLPAPERHFLRVAMLHALAAVRGHQGRLGEAIFIRNAAAAYLRDHLGSHPVLYGFLLVYQASQLLVQPAGRGRRKSDTVELEAWPSSRTASELSIS